MNLYEVTKRLELEADKIGKKPYEIEVNITDIGSHKDRIYITTYGNY